MQNVSIQHPNITAVNLLYSYLLTLLNTDMNDEFTLDGKKGKVLKWEDSLMIIYGNPPHTTIISSDIVEVVVSRLNENEVGHIERIMKEHRDIFEKIHSQLPWNTHTLPLKDSFIDSDRPRNQRNINPATLGDRDVFPGGPLAPQPLGPLSGGGMIMGPDHPIFQSDEYRRNARNTHDFPDGYINPLSIPPGARFDPILPDSHNPLGLPGRRPKNNFSGEPNPDHFQPPNAFGQNRFGGF